MTNRIRPLSRTIFIGLCAVIIGTSAGCGGRELKGPTDELLGQGWNYYLLGAYSTAIRDFEAALAQSEPDSEEAIQALYGLGLVWQLRRPDEDNERATSYYQRLLDIAPHHDLAAWSLLALARMEHLVPVGRDPDYEKVRAAYLRVWNEFPDHMAGHEALIYYYSTFAATLDPNDAHFTIDALDTFIAQHPDSAFITAAWSLKAVCYQTLDMPEEKLHAEIMAFNTAEFDPENPFTDNAWRYWTLATVAEFDAGDFDTARKYYRLLIKEYPTDIRIYASEQALERMDRTEAKLLRERKGQP